MADEFRRDVKSTEPNALVIGDRVFVQALSAGGSLFVFSRRQMQFLVALQKLKSAEAAAISIGETDDWAKKFLSGRKFQNYVAQKMQEYSVKNGMTVEWWYQFGKWLTEGKRTFFAGACESCKQPVSMTPYEAESFRRDDMAILADCPACGASVHMQEKSEAFKPTREQVEGWKELGSRLIPKVERVQHEFEKENFVFESEEAS